MTIQAQTGENCIRGAKQEVRIGTLEKNMDKVQKALFWLITTTFGTLLSLIIGLVLTFLRFRA